MTEATGDGEAAGGPRATMISGPRRTVALCLMKGEEAEATIEAVQAATPDLAVHDHGTYWKIESEGEIRVVMEDVAECLGRPLQLGRWLVILATYVGRAHSGGDHFVVTSEMSYLEGAEAGGVEGAGRGGA
jgi:MmoB/DmpM family